jgi:hypothetical protein
MCKISRDIVQDCLVIIPRKKPQIHRGTPVSSCSEHGAIRDDPFLLTLLDL